MNCLSCFCLCCLWSASHGWKGWLWTDGPAWGLQQVHVLKNAYICTLHSVLMSAVAVTQFAFWYCLIACQLAFSTALDTQTQQAFHAFVQLWMLWLLNLVCCLAAKHLQRASGLESQLSGADNETLPGPCAICAAHEITVPFCAVPCKHTFCYYCLRANCEADHHFTCPTCSTRVDAMKRWYPADLASQT